MNNMLIIGDIKEKDEDSKLNSMSFIHPKHEKDCWYLVGKSNIYEIQTYQDEEHCSLFIDNFVSENNTLYLVNRIDPIYLLIPSLLKHRKHSISNPNKYCLSPLDQLLTHHEINHILNKLSSNKKELESICDSQQIDEDKYYVLNDEKVINFLDLKLKQIENTLQNDASISINSNILNDALCILNEYIPSYYFEKLCTKYNVSSKRVIEPRKRKKSEMLDSDTNDMNETIKKRKIDDVGGHGLNKLHEDINRMNVEHNYNSNNQSVKKPVSKSRAISKLAKVNTKGMKSMMSYFKMKK